MAWTAPRTWVASEVVTAALLNTHLRDNLIDLRALHGARVSKSGTQSIVTGAGGAAVTFDTETYDTDAIHSTVSNTSRLTVPSGFAGYWFIRGTTQWAAAAGGSRRARIRLNNTTDLQWAGRLTGNVQESVEAMTTELLAVGDFVELFAEHTQGAGLNVQGGRDATTFEMHFVGA